MSDKSPVTAIGEPPALVDGTPADSAGPSEPMIDPELMDLPAPPHVHHPDSPNGTPSAETTSYLTSARDPSSVMTITESIALAPQPRTTDFSMLPLNEEGIDLEALDAAAEDGTPGSPTAKLMKVIAPPNAAQVTSNWPAVSYAPLSNLLAWKGWHCRISGLRERVLMWRLVCSSHHPTLVSTCLLVSQPLHLRYRDETIR